MCCKLSASNCIGNKVSVMKWKCLCWVYFPYKVTKRNATWNNDVHFVETGLFLWFLKIPELSLESPKAKKQNSASKTTPTSWLKRQREALHLILCNKCFLSCFCFLESAELFCYFWSHFSFCLSFSFLKIVKSTWNFKTGKENWENSRKIETLTSKFECGF